MKQSWRIVKKSREVFDTCHAQLSNYKLDVPIRILINVINMLLGPSIDECFIHLQRRAIQF